MLYVLTWIRKNIFGKAAFFHLLISGAVATLVAGVVFFFWFPGQIHHLAGGLRLFLTVVIVDVVCGPLLTLLLYRPTKTRLALSVDFTLIAVMQLLALGYGVNALAQARPIAIVFEIDRFRMVSYADITENDLKDLPVGMSPWNLTPPQMLGVRLALSPEERLESFNAALQGVDAGQRPKRWQAYSMSRGDVLARSKPLLFLKVMYPEKKDIVDEAVESALTNRQAGETHKDAELRWLPLVSRSTLEWVALIDPATQRIRAFAPLDGFSK